MSKVLTTTQPNSEGFELRSNNAGNFIARVETVTPDWIADAYTDALAVSDWYLDAVTGSDQNDGITPSTALQSGAELQRRLGPQAAWSTSVTIHVGVGGVTDTLSIIGDTLLPGVHVDVIGTPTLVADAGLVTAYTAMDHVTPRSPTIACAGITDWTPYVGMRLRITSGANAGAVTWVLKANPHALGLSVARTGGRWYKKVSGLSQTVVYASVTPAPGDPVVIETLPIVNSLVIKIGGAVDVANLNDPWSWRQYSVESIAMEKGLRDCSSDVVFYRSIVFGCKMQSFISVNGSYGVSTASASAVSCLLIGNTVGSGIANGVWVGGCFLALPGTTYSIGNNLAQPGRFIYCVGQSISFQPFGPDLLNNVQTFDNIVGYGAISCRGQGITLSGVSSCDNANYGLLLVNGSSSVMTAPINITGATANVRLASTTPSAVNLPLTVLSSSIIPMIDFSWKGAATLVAGTAVVTVPYVNWADQTVTFSRKDPLGTIGDLSVPTATRTATGFTINSSNVADVSTINWQISALGRNILVSK
jgi:hypothetical protein